MLDRRTLAVELGEVGEHAAADARLRKGLARRPVEPVERRAGRPCAAGQRGFQIGRRRDEHGCEWRCRARRPSARALRTSSSYRSTLARRRPRATARRTERAADFRRTCASAARPCPRPRIECADDVMRPGRSQAARRRPASPRRPSDRGRSRAAARRAAVGDSDRRLASSARRNRRAGRRRDGTRHTLAELVAGLQRVGPRQRERPHIGLVGGVGPVALVLHLEGVALHAAGDLEARRELVRQRAQIHHRLHRIDQVRKCRLDDAARRHARRWPASARHALDGMEDDEAGAVGEKVRDGLALGREAQPPPAVALDDRAR